MARVRVTYPDAERMVVDYLTDELDGEDCTVGVGVPADWTPADTPHIRVALDGIPIIDHPVLAHATVRLVAYAATTTAAKELAALALGVLGAHPGGGGVASTRPLTGPQPARDPDTKAEIAAATCRVSIRSMQFEL